MIVLGKVALLSGVRSASPGFLGHGTVVHNVVPPRGHKLRVKERDRAVLLVDNRVEHVTSFPIKHDRRVGFRFDLDFVKILLPVADKGGQFAAR